MFNSTSNVNVSKRIAYNPGIRYELSVKQATSVAYRRATNGQKPKYSVRQLQYAMGMVVN